MIKLKDIGIALLLGGIGFRAGAQAFNLRCDPFVQGQQEGAWAVEVNGDGKYVVIASAPFQDSLYYSSVVTSILIDQQGQVLSVARVIDPVHATYPGWSNSTHKRSDGGFVIGGSNFREDSLGNWIQRPVLYFCDSEGAMEQFIELGPQNEEWIGRHAKQTPDGGYVICGETSSVGNALQAFVIKTDAQGNEEWTKTYGGQWNDFVVSTDTSLANGYLTGGMYRLSASNAQFWVQCLNDTGAVQWEKIWGGTYSESNSNVSVAQNGDVLVAGAWAYGNNALGRRYLARLAPVDGAFVWQYEYGPQAIDVALQVVKEIVPSMDLIAAGLMAQGPTYLGTLFRTTSSGDSLWMRHYQYHDSIVSNGSGIFRDVVPTSDGGFIAVGTALQVPGAYTQDVWVVKVDSMGCLEPGCHLISGVQSQVTNLRDALTVAPNPANDVVRLTWELPVAMVGSAQLSVVSAAGQLVNTFPVAIADKSLTLDVTAYPAGLYHLHLVVDGQWVSGCKVVVE